MQDGRGDLPLETLNIIRVNPDKKTWIMAPVMVKCR
jgi:hypothetical protein